MRYGILVASLLAVSTSAANADGPSFKAAFHKCSEFAGEGYVGLEKTQTMVPDGYTITASSPGQAPIVVRMTHCDTVQVDQTPAVPTTISQIGINVVSPDGTGTINNYMLIYVTNNKFLAQAFAHLGVPVSYDENITYEYTLNAAGTGGTLFGAVPDAGVPAYFLYGPETEPPPNSAVPFLANWWYGKNAAVRQQTNFPAISFGSTNVVLYTSAASPLGQLIGGSSYGNYSLLALHGEYDSAEMVVTGFGR